MNQVGSATRWATPLGTAPLNFISPQISKPAFYSAAYTGSVPDTMFTTETHPVTIGNMRDIDDHLSIDREGFELLYEPTEVADLYDDAAIEERYLPEIEGLLRRRFGASEVVVFDVTRRSDAEKGAANPTGRRGPADRLHVDYTEKSGPQRAKDTLGEDRYAQLTAAGARILQVNVWRPIKGPVERSALVLADASSIDQRDLVATDQIFPDRVGEIYHLTHEPRQRWYAAPGMTRDEVLLIKGWDRLNDGRAQFTPHSAFNFPDTPADAAARESIEVRTYVVIEDNAA